MYPRYCMNCFSQPLLENKKPAYREFRMQSNVTPAKTPPAAAPGGPTQGQMPPSTTPAESVASDINYTQGYLRTQIGSNVRVEFLIGTNMLVDRVGQLMDVGFSYIIIKPTGTDDRELCDIYSIKFITFLK